MGGNQCCSESSKCGDQEGDCDRDSDCINGLVCGKDNCIQNNDFWWDATDDCCEKPRSNYESLLYFNLFNPNIDDCIANRIHVYYHTNLQKCAQETFLNIPLSLETINQGHQLERDVLNHVFMKQEDGDQVTASQKTVIGEQNVFPVQVHRSFFFYH